MRLLPPLQPALAALLAACVLLLGWAAYSPALHQTLHNDGHGSCAANATDSHHATAPEDADAPDHSCAVTLFAAGCDAPSAPLFLSEPALNAIRVAHFTEFMLARTLRGPARVCGPPASV